VSPVVADTGPLRYLVLIDAIEVLPRLFGRVLISEIVGLELSRPSAPPPVRNRLASAPAWLESRGDPPAHGVFPPRLGAGARGDASGNSSSPMSVIRRRGAAPRRGAR